VNSKTKPLLLVVGVIVTAALAAVIAMVALGGGKETATKAEYRAIVVTAVDRVDYALGRLSKAKTLPELLDRMDEAAVSIEGAASDLDEMRAPAELESEHAKLEDALRKLSNDVQGTADQARVPGFEDLLFGAHGLDWDSWDDANAALEAMQKKGLEVALLSRQTTS